MSQELTIRRRDGSIWVANLPDFHDERTLFRTREVPGALMPDIFLVHPEHPAMKLNTKTRQFEVIDISQVPPPPAPVPQVLPKKKWHQKITGRKK